MICAAVAFTACDSIEDTYKEFAGDGAIRYPGKCKNVTVSPGWECIRASWELSNDPAIKSIVVTCASETDTIVKELEPTATECKVENLSDNNYNVTVQSKAADGLLSLAESYTQRPYTYAHEAVRAFTRGFSKSYFCNNHILLIMSGWDDGIESFTLKYTDVNGNSGEKELTKEVFDEKYVDVANVDLSKPITMLRRATIEGCPDVIDFEPITLSKEIVFNTDFQKNMNARYGLDSDSQSQFAASAETIEIDNDLYSLEDILAFTKLKKVIMGKNHYYDGKHFITPQFEDATVTKWVLNKMNEINGLVIEQYGDCYIDDSWRLDFVTKKEYSSLPALSYLDTTGWKISNSEEDMRNDYLTYLLDNDATTTWSSWPSTEGVRKMQITVDMTKEESVSGVKVVQTSDTETENYQPTSMSVEYSDDNRTWHSFTYAEDNVLGTAQGETTLLVAAKATKARYLRFTFNEVSYKGQVKIALADIAVY